MVHCLGWVTSMTPASSSPTQSEALAQTWHVAFAAGRCTPHPNQFRFDTLRALQSVAGDKDRDWQGCENGDSMQEQPSFSSSFGDPFFSALNLEKVGWQSSIQQANPSKGHLTRELSSSGLRSSFGLRVPPKEDRPEYDDFYCM